MFSDAEMLAYFEEKISKSFFKTDSCLVCDDQYLYRILKHPNRITCCPLCGGDIKHSITSYCAGHGEFPRFVVFSCLGRCKFSFESSISYCDSYDTARLQYLDYCNNLRKSIISSKK